MSEMVERVAKAIAFELATGPADVPAAYQADGFLQSVARAAIIAMREPTGDMISAVTIARLGADGPVTRMPGCRRCSVDMHHAAIDAALT